jgi:hypothetical protein
MIRGLTLLIARSTGAGSSHQQPYVSTGSIAAALAVFLVAAVLGFATGLAYCWTLLFL